MVKEVEIRKLDGKTQYVDWESGEELFKKSDCIPIKLIKEWKTDLDKQLEKEDMNSVEFTKLVYELDFYNILLNRMIK